jgi:murein DD-endopeptidase MepM/ murein hydrolase activator NlpD
MTGRRIVVSVLAAAFVALLLPAVADARYGWPLKPFGRAHPVRGQLNDPRPGSEPDGVHAFHFGLDIVTPDGTAVYAVRPGRVRYVGRYALAVRGPRGESTFAYWHVRPIAKNGSRVKEHALLGRVAPGYGHLHFGEKRHGRYVNPLRRGALTPYADTTRPTIASVSYYDGASHDLTGATISGAVRLTVNAFDTPQLQSDWSWAVVTPARVAWQLYDQNGLKVFSGRWGLGGAICRLDPLLVFAPGTLKNNKYRPGSYDYWLGRTWDTGGLEPGGFWLVVSASDIRGNETTKIVTFSVSEPVSAPDVSS